MYVVDPKTKDVIKDVVLSDVSFVGTSKVDAKVSSYPGCCETSYVENITRIPICVMFLTVVCFIIQFPEYVT